MSQGIINQILAAEEKYQSVKEMRVQALSRLRAMGCAFGDIKARCLKEARREQYYSSDEELLQAKKDRRQWYVHLFQFIDWTYRTYSNYDVLLVKEDRKPRTAPKTVKVAPAKLTDKRVEKILSEPENVKIIAEALKENGVMVIQGGILTSKDAEVLCEREDNIEFLVKALEEQGYHVAPPVQQAVGA